MQWMIDFSNSLSLDKFSSVKLPINQCAMKSGGGGAVAKPRDEMAERWLEAVAPSADKAYVTVHQVGDCIT
ncbi:hypothetical protein L1987_25272 [Smallanthus sonchifolius]|uniref:Uncharacterized protein n=1 Tax=Smallanthus sonchifolius TaxID=185202 RepID=A0ACB9INC3_9ASTR|nr:hypothetical protein L1987_25272 [Smallanthus sonchifolius]